MRMSIRFTLTVSAVAALLAGCGAPQAPLGAPVFKESGTVGQRASGSTYKVGRGLLFVANSDPEYPYDDILVYDAKKRNPSPLVVIRDGVSQPSDACVDGSRTLYVVNDGGSGSISEYPLGKASPSKTISTGVDEPAFCAIDHRGDLWVTNINARDVAEYLPGANAPHAFITDGITYLVGIAIDHIGNVYVANHDGESDTNVQVYRSGARKPSRTITDGVDWPVGIGVDAAGTLYVTNLIPGNICEYRLGESKPYRKITQEMNGPAAVTFARNGWMYVTNFGSKSGGSGPGEVVLEFPPGSSHASRNTISDGLRAPAGTAYYPPLLP